MQRNRDPLKNTLLYFRKCILAVTRRVSRCLGGEVLFYNLTFEITLTRYVFLSIYIVTSQRIIIYPSRNKATITRRAFFLHYHLEKKKNYADN
jgi:hypothetical protein